MRFLHSSGREPLPEFGLEIQASLMDGGDSTGALVCTQQQLAEVQSRVAGGIEELQSIRLGSMLPAAVLASVCVRVCVVLYYYAVGDRVTEFLEIDYHTSEAMIR